MKLSYVKDSRNDIKYSYVRENLYTRNIHLSYNAIHSCFEGLVYWSKGRSILT